MSIITFSGPHEFLSNFSPCEIFYNGLWFNTTEAAFQAAKCKNRLDAQRISAAPTPGKAKRLGRKVEMVDDWDIIKVSEMLNILRLKFTRGSEFANALDKTGDVALVEGNTWHDTYWGVCVCPKCAGNGTNMLGQILMHIREENRQGQQLPFEPCCMPQSDWIFPF